MAPQHGSRRHSWEERLLREQGRSVVNPAQFTEETTYVTIRYTPSARVWVGGLDRIRNHRGQVMSRLGPSLASLVIVAVVFGSPLQAQEDRTLLTVRLTEEYREAIESAPGKLTWEMIGKDLSHHLQVEIQPDQAWVGQNATRSIRLVAVTLDPEGQVVDRTESEPIQVTADEAAGGVYRPLRPTNPFPGLNINVPSENYLPDDIYSPEATFSPQALSQSVPEELRAALKRKVGIMVYAHFAEAGEKAPLVRPLVVTVVPRSLTGRGSTSRSPRL